MARLARVGLLFFALALFALFNYQRPGWHGGLDEFVGDLGWRIAANRAAEKRVILVDIGESSLRELGPWPWPRTRLAELSRRLAGYGVSRQIYDIVFEAPREGDAALAAALAGAPGIIAQVFVVDHGAPVQSGTLQGAIKGMTCPPAWAQAQGYVAPAAGLASAGAGHITPRIDNNGAVHRMPALVCHQGKAYPALALAGLAAGNIAGWQLAPGQGWLEPAWRLQLPGVTGPGIPIAASGDLRIPYNIHPDGLIAIAAADIFASRVPQSLLRDSIVIVGSTALGVNDAVPTPFNGATAGMLIHAELLAGLLDQRIPYIPQSVSAIRGLAFTLLAGALILVAGRMRRASIFLPLWGVGGVVLVLAFDIAALVYARLWLGFAQIAAPLLLSALLLAVYEHWRSRSERERLFSHLSSYLPPAVASSLAGQQPSGAVLAERREITALIADIRNFSAYCEQAPAEEVAAVLHAFIVTAQQIVEQHGGVLETVHGDSIVAIWPGVDARALPAARALLQQAADFLPATLPENLAPLALGIGVEAGPALIGSIGPRQRRTHAAMGATITTANCLQAMTVDLAEGILIGPVFATILPADQLRGLGQFLLEGMRRPQNIFAPAL